MTTLFGTTYSHKEIEYLRLDREDSLVHLIAFGFDIVRLCVYWDEVQPTSVSFDFSDIKALLDKFESAHQKVIVTVGMKAPRWPEFYIPKWVEQNPDAAAPYVLPYIEQTIKELKHYSCITHWQVENEPLDPSGPDNFSLRPQNLENEIQLVKSLDDRPIIVTLWGNEVKSRGFLPIIAEMADVVGVDLYYKYPAEDGYHSLENIRDEIRKLSKQLWVTELQAEPWEVDGSKKFHLHTESMDDHILKSNVEQALQYHPEVILFWGFEYWLWRKAKGDTGLWSAAKEIIHKHR